MDLNPVTESFCQEFSIEGFFAKNAKTIERFLTTPILIFMLINRKMTDKNNPGIFEILA